MSDSTHVTDETPVVEQPASGLSAISPVVLAGAVIATIAAAAAVWFFLVTPLLLGDDAGTEGEPPTAAPDDASPPPTGEEETSPDGSPADEPDVGDEVEQLPIVTYEVFLSRDPFEPVVPEPEEETSEASAEEQPQTITDGPGSEAPEQPADPDSADPGGADPPTSDPDQPGTGAPPPTNDGSRSCGAGTDTVCDGRTLSLVAVSSDEQGPIAAVQVDTTIYEVREGDVFARDFLVQSIADDQVTLLYGDEVVTLRQGERVLK